METITYINFWLNYSIKNNSPEKISIAVKKIDNHFCLAREIFKSYELHLFLFSEGTQINDNEYLKSLKTTTELIVCPEKQVPKLYICFERKR